jgi:hypothetical protein
MNAPSRAVLDHLPLLSILKAGQELTLTSNHKVYMHRFRLNWKLSFGVLYKVSRAGVFYPFCAGKRETKGRVEFVGFGAGIVRTGWNGTKRILWIEVGFFSTV